ncbi:SIR2 family protein [Corallococcus sp. AB050B]|nr:SIR2 family protein [Corallococcus sp. AB050B]
MTTSASERATRINRLVSIYDAGKLVPFLGAGMSFPTCPLWRGFVEKLERAASLKSMKDADLLQRSFEAVRRLRRRDSKSLPQEIRKALCVGVQSPPERARLLSQVYWPLVLTTNYDDLFLCAAQEEFKKGNLDEPFSVLGRSPMSCQRVLSSLHESTEPILWALHGFLGGQGKPLTQTDVNQDTSHELIVGHEEYRQVTHKEPHFRRAFAEVVRNRSFLFLGTSLNDPHLLGLFEEILALGGANPLPHFAVVFKGDEIDRRYLESRLNTILIELSDYNELEPFLSQFVSAVSSARSRVSNWSYSMLAPARVSRPTDTADLELVRGRITLPQKGECVALSAGFDAKRQLLFNKSTLKFLDEARAEGLLGNTAEPELLRSGDHIARYPDSPFLIGVARDTESAWDKRDLRFVFKATFALLDEAALRGFRVLRTQLLAAGKSRHFPGRFSLTQMLRAYAAWRRVHVDGPELRMMIHIYARDATFELAAGRIDVPELLNCDDFRFWVEVSGSDAKDVERQLFFMRGDVVISQIAEKLDLEGDGWMVSVTPAPTLDEGRRSFFSVKGRTLDELGVMPGSTLRFSPGPASPDLLDSMGK